MADEFCRHGVQAGNYCATCGREVVSVEMAMAAREADPTESLPPVLRDQSIIVPQDAAVFEKIAEWAKAPSDTASGYSPPEPRMPDAAYVPREVAHELRQSARQQYGHETRRTPANPA